MQMARLLIKYGWLKAQERSRTGYKVERLSSTWRFTSASDVGHSMDEIVQVEMVWENYWPTAMVDPRVYVSACDHRSIYSRHRTTGIQLPGIDTYLLALHMDLRSIFTRRFGSLAACYIRRTAEKGHKARKHANNLSRKRQDVPGVSKNSQ